MSLSRADRLWILKQLRKARRDADTDHRQALREVLTEEAQLAVLQALQTAEHPTA